jgi:sugar lactone lactonase YvrE
MRKTLLSRVKSGFLATFLPATLVLVTAPALVAQSSPIVFTGLETYNWGSGGPNYTAAIGLATDNAGNVYVANTSSSSILKVNTAGARTLFLNTGAAQPRGMAVDLTNNLWYTDSRTTGTSIVKHPLSGGVDVVLGGFHSPYSIAVDSLNNLYVVNAGDNTVSKVTAGVVSAFITSNLPAQARGIAIDNSNNLYVGDLSGKKVYHYNATTGAFIGTLVPSAACEVRDLAVNGAGDLFVGCQHPVATIYRVPFEGTEVNVAHESLVNAVGVTSGGVHGLAFGNGILFAANGTNTVDKIQIDAVDVGSFAITRDATFATSVTLTFASISDTATPISTSAWSEGIAFDPQGNAPNDYQLTAPASGTDCTTLTSLGPINTGTAKCSVKVNFYPNGVGARHGSVVFASDSVPVFTQPIAGVGLGSRIAYGPNPALQYTVAANGVSFTTPAAVVSDGGQNRFVADTGNNRVVEFGFGSQTGTVVGSGFIFPLGVAVDAAGNLYVADAAFGLSVIPNEGGVLNTAHQRTITTTVRFAANIRFDKYQNLYIGDAFNNRVVKLPYEDGQLNGLHQTVVGTGFSSPEGVYPDDSGNVWVADTAFNAKDLTGGRIVKVAPDGTQSTVPIDTTAIPGGLAYPCDVVLDRAGDIYISDTNNFRLLYVSADFATQTTIFTKQSTVAPGFGALGGLWIDPVGTLYATDSLNDLLIQIEPQSFDLAFPNTEIGGSSDPQTIQTSNIGNQALTLEDLVFPTDFQQTPVGSGNVPDCAAQTTLTGGQSCVIGVSFKPVSAGVKNEPLDVVNTDLNANTSPFNTDTFNLSGTPTGTLSLDQTSLTWPVTINNFGPFFSQNVTVTNVGTGPTVVTPSLALGTSPFFTISDTDCGGSLVVGDSCVISVIYKPTSGSGPSTGSVIATDSAGNSVSATLSGSSTTASLTTTPFSLGFTSPIHVPSPSQTFSVNNYTAKPLAVTFSGVDAQFTLTSNCGTLPARTGSCTATVFYTPSSGVGINNAVTVTGTPTIGAATTTTVHLIGTVQKNTGGKPKGPANARIAVSTPVLSFGAQSMASVSAPKTFFITNQAGADGALSISIPNGYIAKTSCTGRLAAGQSCKVDLTFRPTSSGVTGGLVTVTLFPNDGGGSLQAVVNLKGVGK